ncbi:MAG: outer membrane beta-barrel protein, partial [Pseudomonadota bacterium]
MRSGVGYTTNAFRESDGAISSAFNSTSAFVAASSDWDRHKSNIALFGNSRVFIDEPDANSFFARTRSYNRLDLAHDTKLELVGSYIFDSEPRDDSSDLSNF